MQRTTGRLDWWGTLLGTLGLGALVYGLIEAGSLGFGTPLVPSALALGLVALLPRFMFHGSKIDVYSHEKEALLSRYSSVQITVVSSTHPFTEISVLRHRIITFTNMEIGIESNGEVNVLKGMYIQRRERATYSRLRKIGTRIGTKPGQRLMTAGRPVHYTLGRETTSGQTAS